MPTAPALRRAAETTGEPFSVSLQNRKSGPGLRAPVDDALTCKGPHAYPGPQTPATDEALQTGWLSLFGAAPRTNGDCLLKVCGRLRPHNLRRFGGRRRKTVNEVTV